LIYWDEGKFSLEGLRLLTGLQSMLGMPHVSLAGKAVGTAKPTHALLIALSYALLGVHDYAPLFMDATASVLEIAVLYLLGRRLLGRNIALLAALFLAVSEYDAIYARSALSESDASLFFLGGVLVWSGCWFGPPSSHTAAQDHALGRRFLGAVLMGLAFTTNYRIIVYVAFVVALDLLAMARQTEWRSVAHSIPTWAAGLALVPLLWVGVDLLTRAHGLVLFQSEITYRPTSYLSEVAYQLHGGKQAALRFRPLPYIEWYTVRQGPVMPALLVAGLGMAAATRSLRWLLPALLVLGPYIVYVFAPLTVPRNLVATLPFAALLAAATVVTAVRRLRPRSLAVALLAALAVFLGASGSQRSWALTAERSGLAQAVDYVQRHERPRALVVNEAILFYLRGPGRSCAAPRLPKSLKQLAAYDQAHYDYAIIDQYKSPLTTYLRRHARLVAQYPALGALGIGENLIASENGAPPSSRSMPRVDIYAVDSLHLPPPGRQTARTCTLDRLA
jgi:hypothetical protein